MLEFLNGIPKRNRINTDFVWYFWKYKKRKYEDKIVFGAHNVRGLSSATKKEWLFWDFKKYKVDFFLLQKN